MLYRSDMCWRIYARLCFMLYTLVYIRNMLVIFNSQNHRPFISHLGRYLYHQMDIVQADGPPKLEVALVLPWSAVALRRRDSGGSRALPPASGGVVRSQSVGLVLYCPFLFYAPDFSCGGRERSNFLYHFVSIFLIFSWSNDEPRSSKNFPNNWYW